MKNQEFEVHGESARLIILLHAYTASPIKMLDIRKAVLEEIPDADIFLPELPARLFSLENPIHLVLDLLDKIDKFWQDRKTKEDRQAYQEIIIIGHSLGALLGRKLYVYACGEPRANLFEPEIRDKAKICREWASKVKRIILFAGMNRGWQISHHMPLTRLIPGLIGIALGNLIFLIRRKRPLIFYIRRGSPFLTNLRIQWLEMKKFAHENDVEKVVTIQLLGSVDDLVGPDDNIDLVSGEDFYYIDIPFSDHSNVVRLKDKKIAVYLAEKGNVVYLEEKEVGEIRKEIFSLALTGSPQQLAKNALSPQDLQDQLVRQPKVQNVVFVIHGIRDLGYWTRKIARRVQKMGNKKSITVESETSTYGYFPLLSFLLPWKRREKVEWLMDQYAQALATYPNAEFSFVGHSHGTYLLAKALEEYPSCRFKNVVFAGSVVRTDYEWSTKIAKGQVNAVLNYVATGDFVVAIFPKAFQLLGLQDLGSAGHDGFSQVNNDITNIQFIKGDHGAALNESNWDAIAKFIVECDPNVLPFIPPEIIQDTNNGRGRSRRVVFLGWIAPIIWLIIILAIVSFGYSILISPFAEWLKTTIFFGYLWLIFQVLTRL
jgi:pimeloyl-ACP methyl ester carboxylesterase